MHHRPRGTLGQRLEKHLIRPRRLVVGVKEKVGVTFDEPGKESQTREIDFLGATSDLDLLGGTHGSDPVPLYEHHPSAVERGSLAIVHPVRSKESGSLPDGGSWEKENGEKKGCRCMQGGSIHHPHPVRGVSGGAPKRG